MSRYWPTLLLAGVLAGLGGYLYFVELPEQRTEVVTATQAKQILPFAEAQGLVTDEDVFQALA